MLHPLIKLSCRQIYAGVITIVSCIAQTLTMEVKNRSMAIVSHQANKLVKVIAEILNFLLVIYHVMENLVEKQAQPKKMQMSPNSCRCMFQIRMRES
jgi:hypothetical protein